MDILEKLDYEVGAESGKIPEITATGIRFLRDLLGDGFGYLWS